MAGQTDGAPLSQQGGGNSGQIRAERRASIGGSKQASSLSHLCFLQRVQALSGLKKQLFLQFRDCLTLKKTFISNFGE